MLFYNGRILTQDPANPVADFIRIEGKVITEVGNGSAGTTDGIDLQGKTLLPGLFDTHLHLANYGAALRSVNLRGCNSIDELVGRVEVRVKQETAGTWIFGRGWDENRYGGTLPTRTDLDKVAPENPVVLSRVCGHLIAVNTAALKALQLDESTPVPEGGAMDRDAVGALTGIFRETAMGLIFERLPRRGREEVEENLRQAGEAALALGITTVHTDDLGGVSDLEAAIEMYRKLWREGKIPRTHLHIHVEHIEKARALGLKTGVSADGVTIGGVKIFADGSLGARTAAMREDYSDAPGERGILVYSDEEMYRMAKAAHSADFSLAIHAIGDAAAAQVLKTIAQLHEEDPKPYLRHRMIHAQILDEAIIEQMARYNVIAEIQPVFINTDLHWAESRVGERIRTSYNWQTLWQRGIHLTGSSDCPVEPLNPLLGIYSAVTRKDLDGQPEGGWYLEEGLTLQQTLQLFTVGGAYTGGEEGQAGSLKVGNRADLVILDRPIDQIPADEIKDLKVLMTMIDGKMLVNHL